tara:strand:+ start:2541 stop:2921 length:381 start_codon:yes stop_codon:yes gene_type:complete
MKAYLINPIKEEISVVDYNGDFHQILKFIDAEIFDAVYPFKNADTIYVDDMGLMKPINHYFQVKCDNGNSQDLFGLGLVLGSNEEGESIDAQTTLKELKKRITFKGGAMIETNNNGFEVYPFGKVQ